MLTNPQAGLSRQEMIRLKYLLLLLCVLTQRLMPVVSAAHHGGLDVEHGSAHGLHSRGQDEVLPGRDGNRN